MKKVRLSVRYFPPYDKFYVSVDSHMDDYLRGGSICRKYPTYFPTQEAAETARDAYVGAHPDEVEAGDV